MICKQCKKDKKESEFRLYKSRVSKIPGRRTKCKKCESKESMEYIKNHPDLRIYHNMKYADKARGQICTVTRTLAKELLMKPCSYCGSYDNPSIDRINNQQPHTPENVIACCLRCNCLKSDMPEPAWKELLPSIKSAQQKNLFGDWVGHSSKRS